MAESIEHAPDGPKELKPVLREPYFVPESKSAAGLFSAFRERKHSITLTVDEFGGAEGIVAIEDIVEEVVQDMEDEYDAGGQPSPWIRKLGERDYLVSARLEMDDLQGELGIKLPKTRYTTLAGFLLERSHEIPPVSKVIEHEDISFTIRQGTPLAILEVQINW